MMRMAHSDADWITVLGYENIPGLPRPMASLRA